MEYYAVDNQGEVCVKGTNVFHGYYKDPERTAEAIDEYGWHHTGDVGMWLPNGSLKIIDRRKHIFKLSQGEYCVPEKIETIYATKCQYVHQVFVYGESLKASNFRPLKMNGKNDTFAAVVMKLFLNCRAASWQSSCPTLTYSNAGHTRIVFLAHYRCCATIPK